MPKPTKLQKAEIIGMLNALHGSMIQCAVMLESVHDQ